MLTGRRKGVQNEQKPTDVICELSLRFEDKNYQVTVIAEMKFKILQMFKMHRKKEVFVDVDFIRIAGKSSCNGS